MALSEKFVVNCLRKEYSIWASSLTDVEKHAIKKYSYNSMDRKPNRFFERLNAMLRNDYVGDDYRKLEEYAEIISKALKKHPLEQDIICYRGMDANPVQGVEIGSIISFGQFISTSVIKTKALCRKYKMIIRVPKGTKGAYIESLSVFPKQREFLLDKDCYYKLLSIKGEIIELEVQ